MSRTRSNDSSGGTLGDATLPRRAASAAAVVCRSGHPCASHAYTNGHHTCDVCRVRISANARGGMRCDRCDYDVCAACVSASPASTSAPSSTESGAQETRPSAEAHAFECFTCCSSFDSQDERVALPCCSSGSICRDCFRICLNTAISDGKVRFQRHGDCNTFWLRVFADKRVTTSMPP
jgi:hypothetical protein